MNTIITIGRQFGSGGREIGEKVAEYFGIKCLDKELLTRAAKESGFCEEMIKTTMRGLLTPSSIIWSWTPIPSAIMHLPLWICPSAIKYFLRSLIQSRRLRKKAPASL